MKYLDSGGRDPANALGHWLESVVRDGDVVEVRWQSGFFTADGLGFLAPTLDRIRGEGGTVVALIGSNDGDTLRADVERLLPLLGIPRAGARLGVVSFAGAFFHPKTYYLARRDGSQAAYVGSSNLTSAGIGSLHVEAGLVLDTREGDASELLTTIAGAAAAWFADGGRPGLTLIDGPIAIARLVAEGILAEAPRPRVVNEGGGGNATTRPGRPRLRPLVAVPPWGPAPEPSAGSPGTPPPQRPSAVRAGFPGYLRFDPAADDRPTVGEKALTGTALPGQAAGLIFRLNRDSARVFAGQGGTANISLPVNTLSTLRFGVYRGRYERPRAEYGLYVRYIGGGQTLSIAPLATNVMAYGYIEHESSHGNVRMLLPTAVRSLGVQARAVGLPGPAAGDLALLEWPTLAAPDFRLTLVAPGEELHQRAQRLFDAQAAAGQLVVDGACWLPPAFCPPW